MCLTKVEIMITAMHRKAKLGLALLGSLLAMSLGLISAPASAQAEITYYCGGWLSSGNSCSGAPRWLHDVYGWGEQGGVCVQVQNISTLNCVWQANTGVYSATGLGYDVHAAPWIKTTTGGSNFVHGIAGSY